MQRDERKIMAIDETSKAIGQLLASTDSIRNQTKDQWEGIEALERDINSLKVSIKGVCDAIQDLETEVGRLTPIVTDLKEAKIKAYFFLALIGFAGGGLSIAGGKVGEIIGLWS